MPTPRVRLLACAVLAAAVAAIAPGVARAENGAAAGEAGGPAAQSEETEASDAPERKERRRSCRTLARQIAHFEDVAERADERDNELWKRSTELHIQRLEAYRESRGCPGATDPGLGRQAARALRKLGRLALTATTFGAL